MRVLITGGAGFIGSHTVDKLLAIGHDVIVFDNFKTGKKENLPAHSRLQIITGDVLDYVLLRDSIAQVDAVLHLAALSSVPQSIADPILSHKVNTLGFLHVLQAIREIKKPIRLVYASSAAVYGEVKELPCSDEIELSDCALSPYALQKKDNERYATMYSNLFSIQSLGLRYFNVYGPRQDPHSPYSGVIAKFIENAQEEKPIIFFGDGTQSRDFIHVEDVANANCLALQNEYCGILNIATGIAETLLQLASYIKKITGPTEQIFQPNRPGDIPHSYAKVEKAKKILNFTARISLEVGIQSMGVKA